MANPVHVDSGFAWLWMGRQDYVPSVGLGLTAAIVDLLISYTASESAVNHYL